MQNMSYLKNNDNFMKNKLTNNNFNKKIVSKNYQENEINSNYKNRSKKQDFSLLFNQKNISKIKPIIESSESDTNISNNYEKEMIFNSIPIKKYCNINSNNDEHKNNFFGTKIKKANYSNTNNEKYTTNFIFFQRNKDKKMLQFPLFDEKLILKDHNRSYLQDKEIDEVDDSSDNLIKEEEKILFNQIEETVIVLNDRSFTNGKNKLLSRNFMFK